MLALAPTAKERQAADELTAQIEERREARRRLGAWLSMLGSKDPQQVRTAHTQLSREGDAVLPLLLECVRDEENPVLVANTFELLRRFNRPEMTVAAAVDVLRRLEQRASWPHAMRTLDRLGQPGGGAPLLELAISAAAPEQRSTALAALTRSVDPPSDTLAALLPIIHQDGPELAEALEAAHHAVRVHRQFDLISRRGLDELSDEQESLLATLPVRLAALMEQADETQLAAEVARTAQALAISLGQVEPRPLEGISVLSAAGETETSPATAVLDGIWDATDPATMWRHSVDRRSTLVLDLGEERTVTGVRIWNLNEPGGTQRGWKEVSVYVSNSPTALTPVALGLVPPAPGTAETPDYSTLVKVPAVRGRYVTLQARNVWRIDGHTGLSEVQILGF